MTDDTDRQAAVEAAKERGIEYECNYCPKAFDTEFGLTQHTRQMHQEELPWYDRETMETLYTDRKLSYRQIAEELGCSEDQVSAAIERFNITPRSNSESRHVLAHRGPETHLWREDGYEAWEYNYDGERASILVHRLVAVAEWGLDALRGNVVHHKNGVKWDNRPENLQLMTRGEHNSLHFKSGNFLEREGVI